MPLVSMKTMMENALREGYGLGYFEAWDSYSLEAVLEAAEEERSPVILGFGGMMADTDWLDDGGVTMLGAMGSVAAKRARVPVSLIFNEAQTAYQVSDAIDAGFNAVMLDTSAWEWDKAVNAVARLVAYAHDEDVTVEAELGRLPDATLDGIDDSGAHLTDPEQAEAFIKATGADCLAVSIGNVHLLTAHYAEVDMGRLEAIHRRVSVPLVIHGGTSFPPDAVPQAIANGVGKFNVGTILKKTFMNAVRETLAAQAPTMSVHDVLGSHKETDFLVAGKVAMKAKVRELIRLYGSSQRADSPTMNGTG
jgi:fructose-bisphosphate aldolase class II